MIASVAKCTAFGPGKGLRHHLLSLTEKDAEVPRGEEISSRMQPRTHAAWIL